MPTVSVVRDELFAKIGETYTEKEFELKCFDLGIELDEVTSERMMAEKETGGGKDLSDDVIYKIDISANRYDLLCVEGLAQAFRVFLGKDQPPTFHKSEPKGEMIKMVAEESVNQIRPHVVGAILRGVTFTPESYKSFIDLQDKLHMNICRRRTLVAIGTHDLSTLTPPFTYRAQAPSDIKFKALSQDKEMTAEELFAFYIETESHLKKFLPIIKDSPVYPVIYDSNGVVLSMPPIINGEHSKITLDTKDVLIECTATDLTKAHVVLNTMVAMFSTYASEKFSVEPIEITNADETVTITPEIDSREMIVGCDYINKLIGVDLSTEDIVQYLNKMMLSAEPTGENDVKVQIPITRTDIMHPVDVMEDVAVGFGFNNIPRVRAPSATVAAQLPINHICELLRPEVAMAGYSEVLNFSLLSRADLGSLLNSPEDKNAVHLGNPKTEEFQVARTRMLPGLLKTFQSNKSTALPCKLFETGDVVVTCDNDVGAINQRHIAAIHVATTSGFEHIHGLVDRIMQLLSIPNVAVGDKSGYYIQESNDPAFFPKRRADIFAFGEKVGTFGIIHPIVLENYQIPFPASALEITLDSIAKVITLRP
eukprot:TRINITY_DN966_c0_g1_i2.p1 TRINITY_DN966_c0_g1~~TRINITY_DN966_c0_g1_i2.p1  ORF type:complete len:595 (-),score=199.60 TRINITY_DN966_c0_g1_i2:32-1816(-)